MSDILIEEMEDNTYRNRFNKPHTLNEYRLYFGNKRFTKLLVQHFLERGHHRDTLVYTMEMEYLEDTGTIDF